MIQKYKVTYSVPKRKKQQSAVFFSSEDALLWSLHVKKEGCENVEIMPVFN